MVFFILRSNYYSPIYQPIDSVTNILFSSGTTGKNIVRLIYTIICTVPQQFFKPVILVFLLALVRRTKSYSMDTTCSNSICSWVMGSLWSQSWWSFLLADKFRMGDGSKSTLRVLSMWCNSRSLPWITSRTWLWKICSGDFTSTFHPVH